MNKRRGQIVGSLLHGENQVGMRHNNSYDLK